MYSKKWMTTAILLIALLVTSMPVMAHGNDGDLGRETLPPNDGWAAFGNRTTGGSLADSSTNPGVPRWVSVLPINPYWNGLAPD